MKKLLVCDLDGTLLNQKNQIDPNSLFKIKQFIQDGNEFCICTGRLDADIKYVEKRIGITSNYRISQNGAIIRNSNNQLVFSSSIPKDLTKIINQIVFDQGLRVEVSDRHHRYFPSPRPKGQVAEFVDTSKVENDLKFFIQNNDLQIVNYLIFGNRTIFQPLIKQLSMNLDQKINIQQTSPSSLEIFPYQASKGEAVANIMRRLSYHADQLYVAGDAENDTTMFPLTSHSYAVGKLADRKTRAAASQHIDTIGELISEMGD